MIKLPRLKKDIGPVNGPVVEDVATADLHIDPAYQRALGEMHVEDLVKRFNPAALGQIAVSEREDGSLYVLDGHHRWIVCQRVGHKTMQAQVYKDLSPTDEAQLFLDLNFSKSVSPGAKYNARVAVREPQVMAIKEAVEGEGFVIAPLHAPRGDTIAGISKLDKIYTDYGIDTIRQVLQVGAQAWPADPKGREAAMLGGIARFLVVYPNTAIKALATKLSLITPQELMLARRTYMREMVIGTDTACARAIWRHYNLGRRSNKLPNLFDR